VHTSASRSWEEHGYRAPIPTPLAVEYDTNGDTARCPLLVRCPVAVTGYSKRQRPVAESSEGGVLRCSATHAPTISVRSARIPPPHAATLSRLSPSCGSSNDPYHETLGSARHSRRLTPPALERPTRGWRIVLTLVLSLSDDTHRESAAPLSVFRTVGTSRAVPSEGESRITDRSGADADRSTWSARTVGDLRWVISLRRESRGANALTRQSRPYGSGRPSERSEG